MHPTERDRNVAAPADPPPFNVKASLSLPTGRTSPPNSVLSYGHDVMLLHSRKWLLQHAGCPSDSVTSELQYQTTLLNLSPGVIVLCQSLLPEECSTACAFAMEHAPECRLLLLFNRTQKCFPAQHHTLLNSNAGPKVFSQTVFDLLYQDRFTTQQ